MGWMIMHSRSSWNSNILSQKKKKTNLRPRTLLILPRSSEDQNSDLQNPWKHQVDMLTACNYSKLIFIRNLSYCWALNFMESPTSLNKVEEPLRKIPYGGFRLSHRWTHIHMYMPMYHLQVWVHTCTPHIPKNGKKSQKLCKKQKAVFSATNLMPACPLEGVSGDKMSQFYYAFC